MSAIIHLNPDNLQEIFSEYDWIHLNFWHHECGPCINHVNPVLEDLVTNYELPADTAIAKLNVREFDPLRQQFSVKYVPSWTIISDGNYLGLQDGWILSAKKLLAFFTYIKERKARLQKLGLPIIYQEYKISLD